MHESVPFYWLNKLRLKIEAACYIIVNNVISFAFFGLYIDVKVLNVLSAICLLSLGNKLILCDSLVAKLKLDLSTYLCCHFNSSPFGKII